MKNIIRTLAFLLAGVICLSLTACGDFSKEDAATLVEGNINSIYLNVQSDEYLTLCGTTKEECTKDYEDGLEAEVENAFIPFFELDNTMMDDATYNRIIDLYKDIYGYTKFEVGEVTESDGNYLVSVTIYPIDIFIQYADKDYDDFYASYEEKYNDDSVSAEDLEVFWQTGILDLLEARVDKIGYLDPVTLSVQVVPTEEEDGSIYYIIDQNDFSRIDQYIISYDI